MYKTYGGKFIETLAKQQMNLAMRLPVTVGGALMPDAHAGYGLPIGGVLATDNAVIPYAVGVDIGCRMSLTVFDAKADFLKRYSYQIKEALKDFTHFGMDGGLGFEQEHEVLDREEFRLTPLLKICRERPCGNSEAPEVGITLWSSAKLLCRRIMC
jgi:tRNA-splicing ligase RtcB